MSEGIPTADDVSAVAQMISDAKTESIKKYWCSQSNRWKDPHAQALWYRLVDCQRTLDWVLGGYEPVLFEDARELLGIHPGGL